jgi:type I restriction enzyme S subunit
MTNSHVLRLDELGDLLNSKRIPLNSREREQRKGKYPYYGASGIVDHVDDYIFEGEHVLISEDGENLRTRQTPIAFKADGKFWVNNHAHIFKGKDRWINDFIVYFFQNADINPFITGAVQPKLNKENLLAIPISFPDEKIARSVVKILRSLDDKIELNLQMNATLEEIAQAIFKRWFVDFQFPGFDGELVGGLPVGWRMDELRNHLNAERGLSYKGEGLAKQGEGVPMHNLNSVYEGGGYKHEGIKFYSGAFKEKHLAKPRDIIVANTEQGHKYLLIGYPAVVPYYFAQETIYSHHIYRVRPNEDSYLTPQFIYYLLLQPDVRDQVVGCSNGTTVNMLKTDGLQMPEFVLPAKELVAEFSELIENIWQRQESIYIENRTLTNLRDSLLPKLMSGKIRVAE